MTPRNWLVVPTTADTRTDMASDVLQADWAILLDSRSAVLAPQIQMVGETGRMEVAALLREAADAVEASA
jgi:hypothetical protein